MPPVKPSTPVAPRAESSRSTPMCPARAAVAGRRQGLTSFRPTNSPLGPSPQAVEAFRALADQLELYPDGSAHALRAGDRPRVTASIPPGSSAAMAPTSCWRCSRTPFCTPATKASTANTAFSPTRSRSARPAATPVAAEETRLTAERRRDARKRDAAHAARLPRQSQQPDRHLLAAQRGQAPARRPAADMSCS